VCALCWVEPRLGRTLRAHYINDSHEQRATYRYLTNFAVNETVVPKPAPAETGVLGALRLSQVWP